MEKTYKDISILIIDDHQIVLDGLKLMLDNEEGFHCIACINNGKEALLYLENNDVDIILLDIELPEMNGIEICKAVKTNNKKQKIIALTMLIQQSIIHSMLDAGVDGFLIKNAGAQELLFTIKEVYQGRNYYSKEVRAHIKSRENIVGSKRRIPKLSRREKEIIRLIMTEKRTNEIADMLFISVGTVETHRRNILRKLGAKNVAGMVTMVLEKRLL